MELLEHGVRLIAYALIGVGMLTITVLMAVAGELARSINEIHGDMKKETKSKRRVQ